MAQGSFRAEHFYDQQADAVIYYARNVPSWSNRINKYLTLFLADEDDTVVGFEVKGLSIIARAISDLDHGVEVSDPIRVAGGTGKRWIWRLSVASPPTCDRCPTCRGAL